MKKIVNSFALLMASASIATAGGSFSKGLCVPVEPTVLIPEKEVIVLKDDVKYDGFYVGASYSNLSMNEAVNETGHGVSVVAGYYFNEYFGIEGRYTTEVGDLDRDSGAVNAKVNDALVNYGLYVKPMMSVTTGFALYGLAGVGQSEYTKDGATYKESGLQLGLGAKYELANGFGIFADYLEFYDGTGFDTVRGAGTAATQFDALNVGATFTF